MARVFTISLKFVCEGSLIQASRFPGNCSRPEIVCSPELKEEYSSLGLIV